MSQRSQASKVRLRDFQAQLAERLAVARTQNVTGTSLGLLIGNDRYLLSIDEAGEIVAVPPITLVPLTQPWFKGLANIRGSLVPVCDVGMYATGVPTPIAKDSRLLAFGGSLHFNAGLLVTRMLGLRNRQNMKVVEAAADENSWLGAVLEEADGTRWKEIKLTLLSRTESFLQAGA